VSEKSFATEVVASKVKRQNKNKTKKNHKTKNVDVGESYVYLLRDNSYLVYRTQKYQNFSNSVLTICFFYKIILLICRQKVIRK